MYHYESKYGAGRTDGVHVRDIVLRKRLSPDKSLN